MTTQINSNIITDFNLYFAVNHDYLKWFTAPMYFTTLRQLVACFFAQMWFYLFPIVFVHAMPKNPTIQLFNDNKIVAMRATHNVIVIHILGLENISKKYTHLDIFFIV